MSLVDIARRLHEELSELELAEPVAYVYCPLDYAWEPHRRYLERYGEGVDGEGRTLLVGMNPGPWGMGQTGVPFGAVSRVRDWLGIEGKVGKPDPEHPKKPVEGFSCSREEVSGQRLWGWAAERFGDPESFFRRFFVWNYCPLLFLAEGGRNLTPDKLRVEEREAINGPCDRALRAVVEELEIAHVVGVGAFAEERARAALDGLDLPIGRILHPSPASPAANRGWAEKAEQQLREMGVLD